jgi:hypothetical protein
MVGRHVGVPINPLRGPISDPAVDEVTEIGRTVSVWRVPIVEAVGPDAIAPRLAPEMPFADVGASIAGGGQQVPHGRNGGVERAVATRS